LRFVSCGVFSRIDGACHDLVSPKYLFFLPSPSAQSGGALPLVRRVDRHSSGLAAGGKAVLPFGYGHGHRSAAGAAVNALPLQSSEPGEAGRLDAARQYAALPWRVGRNGCVEVLLVTSRHRGRWILPKGWPVAGSSPAQSAAREAFEEAGVIGRLGNEPIGRYVHARPQDDGSVEPRDIIVFGLQVNGTLVDWPEKGERKRAWWPIDEAAVRAGEPGLADLLRTLKPDPGSLPDFLRRDPKARGSPVTEIEPPRTRQGV
jgi:8-oxo-dGTP pyrophosphatase MutT (NUDIX family)